MTSCPCCDRQLLRHIRGKNMYWFCRNCWQEIPLLPKNTDLFETLVFNQELKQEPTTIKSQTALSQSQV